MIRLKLAAIAFALSAFAVAGAATLTGLSWTTAAGKPALRLAISGHRRGRLEVRRHGRLLRVHLRRTTLGTHVRDLPGSGTVKGVYPYLADHGHGVDVDVLLTKRGRMHLTRTSYGYEAVLAGVAGVVPQSPPATRPAARTAAPSAVKALPAAVKAAANGPNVLRKLSYFAFPGNRIELHLVTTKHPEAPSAFVLTKPAMVVLDVPHTVIKPALGELQVGAGDVRNVAAVEANGMTRVVIRLVNPAAYRAYVRPHAIDVIVASPNTRIAQAAIPKPKTPVLAPGPNHRPRYRLRAITFHRGRNGAGKVQVKLSSSNVAVSVHNRGHRIILTFHDTAVPKAEQRKLVVTDFATPIDTIRTFQDGRSARMILHTYGHYTQMGYQAQRGFHGKFVLKP
ncbi:hypothetical protein C4901_16315 [Acidiferrobacter sp. SPIII_3]|uniref:type IV pilus secretin family protein n=1 Tax=Acidiferrobacter sp. SPIII_3 TaxID=1281578 RepID=UPI000D738A97|nr:AMIN domain-containing protein [Acidiferrobacter sp. SPIII_3]AWP24693.1 hypothetical protein C4901_16315 [Acidiferrobacter sp. SPIII_3]